MPPEIDSCQCDGRYLCCWQLHIPRRLLPCFETVKLPGRMCVSWSASMLFEGNERREREREKKARGLLPPGQSLTLKWPVLHYGSVPRFDPERWDFRVYGLFEAPLRFTGRISIGFPRQPAP